jgi:hypothetical protein
MLRPKAGILSLCTDMMKDQVLIKDHRKGQGGSQNLSSPFSERTINFYRTTYFVAHFLKD